MTNEAHEVPDCETSVCRSHAAILCIFSNVLQILFDTFVYLHMHLKLHGRTQIYVPANEICICCCGTLVHLLPFWWILCKWHTWKLDRQCSNWGLIYKWQRKYSRGGPLPWLPWEMPERIVACLCACAVRSAPRSHRARRPQRER